MSSDALVVCTVAKHRALCLERTATMSAGVEERVLTSRASEQLFIWHGHQKPYALRMARRRLLCICYKEDFWHDECGTRR
jgi:hypothetical protein